MSADVQMQPGDVLLIVDVQRDFQPGGNLPVTGGDAVIAPLNAWIGRFENAGLPVFAMRDWHPADHCSFRIQGGTWPTHCIAGTSGAEFAAGLALPASAKVVSKATRRELDAYSGFAGTDLQEQLKRLNVRRIFMGGLATDYCVLNTVQDALRLGYQVILLLDSIRAVDVLAGDSARAIDAMVAAGAVTVGG